MAEPGQTRDPRQLIPGDAAAIDQDVRTVRDRGKAMDGAGTGLKKIDSGAWKGTAGDAFRARFSFEPPRWLDAADAFEATATALFGYAATLRWAQAQAAEAISVWDEGQAATARAEQAHDQAVANAEVQSRAGQPTAVPPFVDPGESKRQAARDLLDRARQQLAEAGERAAAVIGSEAEKAPEQSGWEVFWGDVVDVGEFFGDVGLGLWDGLSGTGEFLWQLSPHHLADNPDHYSQVWAGVTKAASFAAEHPLEFGKQMVSWDEWSKEPGRALGNTAFGLLLVAGAAAKIGTLRKASDAVPDAPNVKPNLQDYFTGGANPKASELADWAEAQGWSKTQAPNGPAKYVDDNGTTRLTLKHGSPRAPGSDFPHVEIRDENGQRTDPFGNPVTRKSPGNHTPIDWDW